MKNKKIYCNHCGQQICECEFVKNSIVICTCCKGSSKITVKVDGSVHAVTYPYELAMKKCPYLYTTN